MSRERDSMMNPIQPWELGEVSEAVLAQTKHQLRAMKKKRVFRVFFCWGGMTSKPSCVGIVRNHSIYIYIYIYGFLLNNQDSMENKRVLSWLIWFNLFVSSFFSGESLLGNGEPISVQSARRYLGFMWWALGPRLGLKLAVLGGGINSCFWFHE